MSTQGDQSQGGRGRYTRRRGTSSGSGTRTPSGPPSKKPAHQSAVENSISSAPQGESHDGPKRRRGRGGRNKNKSADGAAQSNAPQLNLFQSSSLPAMTITANNVPVQKQPQTVPVYAQQHQQEHHQKPAAPVVVNTEAPIKLSDVRFSDLLGAGPLLKTVNTVFNFEFMSPVQADTLPPIRSGSDVLAKARTGTGKTLAFLLPQAERLLAPGNPPGISTVVLAPTRELALQIESEAKRLFSCSRANVMSVIGGRNIGTETRQLAGQVDVLIATPGRLLDHLRSGHLNGKLSALRCVVMDECDMLMDMGFSRDIHAIMAFFPNKQHRQTLLFSATIPSSIRGLADDYCRPGYTFIDCVGNAVETHAHIPQTYMEASYGAHVPLLYALLEEMKTGKAIVFFNTARMAEVVASQLRNSPIAKELGVFEMHSRCAQSQRTRTQKEFGNPSTRAVLLSSDASARGVDYPNVHLVVQIGVALNPAQHVHRVGRTGRAGHAGMAIVLCSPSEQALRRHVCPAVPVHPHAEALAAKANACANTLRKAMINVPSNTRERAYSSWMGAYASSKNLLKWSFAKVAAEAALVAAGALAWDGPVPAIEQKVLKKMNMFQVEGVRSMPNKPTVQGQGGGRGGSRR